jgi:hypothetical protein
MWRQQGRLMRSVVPVQATYRTVAAPILCLADAAAVVAILRPLITATALNMGQFASQAADHFWRELPAPMIAAAGITERRAVTAVQEATVPRAKQSVVVHLAPVA